MNHKTRTALRFGVSALIVLLVSGCESEEEKIRKAAEETNVSRCVNMGGLPVRSIWDGRLVDCIFQPSAARN